MKIAVVGATGLVGSEMLNVLGKSHLHVEQLIPVASPKSVGKKVGFRKKEYPIVSIQDAIQMRPQIALFSAGGSVSKEFAPQFAEHGTTVIDNSSAFRMSPEHKLIVPEINAVELSKTDKIIANPNCSTIQMVLALAPLHKKYGIKRVVVSTYQSVTGTGKDAVDQLMDEREGRDGEKVYPYPIDMNALPHIDVFQDNGYTKEEMKMVHETVKILGDEQVKVTATAVRLPVVGGHSESVNIEFEQDFDLKELRQVLDKIKGLVVEDDVAHNKYPMPIYAQGKDEVFVGRIRRDETQDNTVNMWIVADNLRKGAATNAVQIAEYLVDNKLIAISGSLIE